MYDGISTLKFKINYNPINYGNKTGFNNNAKRWKCEKCNNRFFKGFKELKIISRLPRILSYHSLLRFLSRFDTILRQI